MIRLMTEKDISTVMEIEKIAFHPGWTVEHFKYELTENPFSQLFVLEENRKIIGYIGYWITFDQAQITTIAIHPQERNKGYACKMMEFAIQNIKAACCDFITLEVRKSNIAAQKLYEKFSFVVCGERKNYYGDEDAILMGVGI